MKTQTTSVSAKRLRQLLSQLAEQICSGRHTLDVALTGDTFRVYLDRGTSVAITLCPKGGAL